MFLKYIYKNIYPISQNVGHSAFVAPLEDNKGASFDLVYKIKYSKVIDESKRTKQTEQCTQ